MTEPRTVIRIETPEQIDEWDFIQRMMRTESLAADPVTLNRDDFQRLVLWAVRHWNTRNPGTKEPEAP